jgi:hypothetical protein
MADKSKRIASNPGMLNPPNPTNPPEVHRKDWQKRTSKG